MDVVISCRVARSYLKGQDTHTRGLLIRRLEGVGLEPLSVCARSGQYALPPVRSLFCRHLAFLRGLRRRALRRGLLSIAIQ